MHLKPYNCVQRCRERFSKCMRGLENTQIEDAPPSSVPYTFIGTQAECVCEICVCLSKPSSLCAIQHILSLVRLFVCVCVALLVLSHTHFPILCVPCRSNGAVAALLRCSARVLCIRQLSGRKQMIVLFTDAATRAACTSVRACVRRCCRGSRVRRFGGWVDL